MNKHPKEPRKRQATAEQRRHGLAASTLHRWVRLEGRPRRSRDQPPAFREIRLPVDGLGAWAGEVCLPDGTRVRWHGATGLAGTERLIQQLRRSC